MPNDDGVLTQLKTIRDEIGRDNAELGKRIDACVQDVKQRGELATKTAEELKTLKERTDAIVKDHESLKQKARMQLFRKEGVRDVEHGYFLVGAGIRDQYKRTGADWLTVPQGEADMLKEFKAARATMLESGATPGSYVVPTGFVVDLIEAIEEAQDIVSFADVNVNLPGNVDLPTITARPTFNHKRASKAAAASKGAPAFGQVQIRPEEGTILFDIDNQLIRMSPVDLGRLFVRLMNEATTGGLSYDLVWGDGTDNYNGITGILKVTDAVDRYVLPAGKTSFKDIGYQDFYSVMAKPYARASARGRWFFSRDLLGVVAAVDCTDKMPLMRFEAGQRLLVERPVTLGEDFPLLAADGKNQAFMAYGDLMTYAVGIAGTPQISFSEHVRHEYNQTQARLVLYYDIKRKHTKGVCGVWTPNA